MVWQYGATENCALTLDRMCFIFVSLFCKRLSDWCNVGRVYNLGAF